MNTDRMTGRGNITTGEQGANARNTQSAGFMLLAAVCYSFIPLAVALTGSSANPFLFGMGWRGGIAIGFALFLAATYPRLFFNGAEWTPPKTGPT